MMETWLPHKLRVLRMRQGLTLIDAAKKTGVTRATLSELERGHRHPVAPTLVKIAKGYGVPVEELLEEPVPLASAPSEIPRRSITEGAPHVDREAFVERGVEPSDAEIVALNLLLQAYTELARTGEEKTRITIPEDIPGGGVDMARVYLLVDFALASGIFTPDDVAVLRDGVRAKLVAGGH